MDKEQPGVWADDGELVIPNFPTAPANTFLGLVSDKPAYYARVVDVDISLDDTVDQLAGRYLGLPLQALGTYVLETAVVSWKIPEGSVVQLLTDGDEAKILVRDTRQLYTLWTTQPLGAST